VTQYKFIEEISLHFEQIKINIRLYAKKNYKQAQVKNNTKDKK